MSQKLWMLVVYFMNKDGVDNNLEGRLENETEEIHYYDNKEDCIKEATSLQGDEEDRLVEVLECDVKINRFDYPPSSKKIWLEHKDV